ncbi:uncharacterized protein LOC142231065 [Haematobia irritans]|uniref:uncharacterized protein LOC142231065 n=1 Tax=Haematobia irritans TaxID=7368 RepID=UPI003F4FB283
MGDIDQLISSQRDIMRTVEELYDRFVARSEITKTRGYLSTLGQELDDLYHQFKYQHDEIVRTSRETALDVSDIPYMVESCFYNFSDQYFLFKGSIMDSMPQNASPASPFSSTFAVTHGQADTTATMEAKLPKISLPSFSGDYMEWIPFRDIYLSLVHNNFSLSKVQKFFYLKGTLTGEAAGLIRTISATEANYDSAWNILESRYHNKRMIVGSLMSRLFNIPKSDGCFNSIKVLLDTTQECLSSLRNLDVDTTTWDPVLIHLLCQKLDLQTRKEWEHSLKSSTELPTRKEMFDFLERTFRTLESLDSEQSSSNKDRSTRSNYRTRNTLLNCNVAQPKGVNCIFCSKSHPLSKCYKFLALSMGAKNEFLSNRNVCRNCLSVGHLQDNCASPYRCATCNQAHHTVLHTEGSVNIQPLNSEDNNVSQIASHNSYALQNVFLYTIRLYVNTGRGRFPLRALLDPGSQASLISEAAVQLIGVQRKHNYCKILGVGDSHANISRYIAELPLWSSRMEPVLTCDALVLTKITSYKPCKSMISFPDLEVDTLADPYYYRSDPIDLILGSDVCSKIKIPTESFVRGGLFFQNTHFGWVFSGSAEPTNTSILLFHNVNIESILQSFWRQEDIVDSRDLSNEEILCEDLFRRTTYTSDSGKYVVNLPFRSLLLENSLPNIHNNLFGALKRFSNLESSFTKRPLFAAMYREFMRDYESLGHMSRLCDFSGTGTSGGYFLPHHGVYKESSSTTKLRVVFDGSSHLSGHKPLNEELCPGPALQNDLPQVIMKWRRHRYAFSADIEKMFRQIEVCVEHRPFQKILWRHSPSDEISVYQLNTVTYGTTSAPYLSLRVLRQISDEFKSEFPHECGILCSDSYVDDIISGSDTIEGVIRLQQNLCDILKRRGFILRKWISNSTELLRNIPEEFKDISVIRKFDHDSVAKTLGVHWNVGTDYFSFDVQLAEPTTVSKRSILSESARLFDPLGWLTPSTVIAKNLFKRLWQHGVDWDSKVPVDIEKEWMKYRSSLGKFVYVQIPRWIQTSPSSHVELHCFCDASTTAYAAVVYARVMTEGETSVHLLQSKSKITPIKTVSIPRLELCAAVLGANLVQRLKGSLTFGNLVDIFFWSDSKTVLSWIQKPPSHWVVYVANRVAEIQRLTCNTQWRYVPSSLNPADSASRGIYPFELIDCQVWWNGPAFLKTPPNLWPETIQDYHTSEEAKGPKLHNHMASIPTYPDLFLKFSKLSTLLRIASLCIRFCYNCKNSQSKATGNLGSGIINTTLIRLVTISQKIDFPMEIRELISKNNLKSTPLMKLLPFIDDCGIIRVGGRLQQGSLPYDMKHPMLLSKSNPLSRLIIEDAHEKTLHGGLALTMSYVCRRFWILSGNQLAKTVIHNCMSCLRYSAKFCRQVMGNLPAVRLNVTRPFKHSGVDYAGPITIKNSSLSSSIMSKGYICLFICMVTKAIHLETVSNLTTNSFLAAFRRFVSRRGVCTDIYSDCGTNFVGASKELRVLYNKDRKSLPDDIRKALCLQGTEWHFIPPASPHFGGLWEAGVKSVKYHLKRVIKDRVLSFEELSTLLCQIESCLNSRPLCPLSSDPSDLDALTPAHFLIGEPTVCIPDENLLDKNINHLTRWKSIEKIKQHFWKRWYLEYLNRLQARPKWLTTEREAKVGDLVLITDERYAPAQWPLGRIQTIHPGPDGHVRVVSILTKGKIIKRTINKICFLPTGTQSPDGHLFDSSSSESQHNHDASSSQAVSRSTAESKD